MVSVDGYGGQFDQTRVSLTLRDVNGTEMISVRCRRSVKGSSLKELYSFHTGTKVEHLKMYFNTREILVHNTVAEMGIQDGDIIDVFKLTPPVKPPGQCCACK